MNVMCFDLWPMEPIREAIANVFPTVIQTRVSPTMLKLEVSLEESARLMANLSTLGIRFQEYGQ